MNSYVQKELVPGLNYTSNSIFAVLVNRESMRGEHKDKKHYKVRSSKSVHGVYLNMPLYRLECMAQLDKILERNYNVLPFNYHKKTVPAHLLSQAYFSSFSGMAGDGITGIKTRHPLFKTEI